MKPIMAIIGDEQLAIDTLDAARWGAANVSRTVFVCRWQKKTN